MLTITAKTRIANINHPISWILFFNLFGVLFSMSPIKESTDIENI